MLSSTPSSSLLAGLCLATLAGCGNNKDPLPTQPPSEGVTAGISTAEPDYDGPPRRVLVELFSSQGCNSCPPADALVGDLPSEGFDRDAVVALTYHVTYWDDLGWKDPYANPLFDQRQITYAQRVPSGRADSETTMRGPYTPQMVVDGRVHFSGSLREVALKQIGDARQRATPIEFDVSAAAQERTVDVHVRATMADGADFDTDQSKVGMFVALAQRSLETEVPRGENAGKQLQEHWVVRDFQGPKLFRSAREVNEADFTMTLPEDIEDPAQMEVVVFAQGLGDLHVMGVGTTAIESAQPG